MNKRETALQLTGMALALGVGVLLGARACAPEARVVERTVEQPAEVVYRCPEADTGGPDAGEEPEPAAPAEPAEPAQARQLPDVGAPSPANQRRRLLAWARYQSDGLIGCRHAGAATESVVVTLHLDDTGAIRDAKVNAPTSDDITPRTLTCIQRRVRDWKPPAELVGDRREIVFRLDL
ncbi:MAG: hypothetical protein ACOC9W_00375 [Persicimonas sp.]